MSVPVVFLVRITLVSEPDHPQSISLHLFGSTENVMTNSMLIWKAMYELYYLLAERCNTESEYQDFFENNPIIFEILGLDEAKPFEKKSSYSLPFDPDREYTPEPDFIGIAKDSGAMSIVELKTPFVGKITTSRSDGNRAKFKAEAEGYISQATEYVESIRQRSEAREVLKETFKIAKISDYRIMLVYAQSQENDIPLISELLGGRKIRTEIICYDTLLDMLAGAYTSGRKDYGGRPGWSFMFDLACAPTNGGREFIGEYCGPDGDTLSVFLESGEVVFECKPRIGSTSQLRATLNDSKRHFVQFEFSSGDDGHYMSLNVDNVEQEITISNRAVNFNPAIAEFTIGADASGINGAEFILFSNICINRTLELSEKFELYHHHSSKAFEAGLSFKKQQFMRRIPAGHLIQEKEEFKPWYMTWEVVKSGWHATETQG